MTAKQIRLEEAEGHRLEMSKVIGPNGPLVLAFPKGYVVVDYVRDGEQVTMDTDAALDFLLLKPSELVELGICGSLTEAKEAQANVNKLATENAWRVYKNRVEASLETHVKSQGAQVAKYYSELARRASELEGVK